MSGFVESFREGNIAYQRTSVTEDSATYQGTPVENPTLNIERVPAAVDARWVCLPTGEADTFPMLAMSSDALTEDESTFVTVPKQFTGEVRIAVTGTFGMVNFVIERTTDDPASEDAEWQQFGDFFHVDTAQAFFDGLTAPGTAWWRVRGAPNGNGSQFPNSKLSIVLTGETERVIAPYMVATFIGVGGKKHSLRQHYNFGSSQDWLWNQHHGANSPHHPMETEQAHFITRVFAEIQRVRDDYSDPNIAFSLQNFDEFDTPLDYGTMIGGAA